MEVFCLDDKRRGSRRSLYLVYALLLLGLAASLLFLLITRRSFHSPLVDYGIILIAVKFVLFGLLTRSLRLTLVTLALVVILAPGYTYVPFDFAVDPEYAQITRLGSAEGVWYVQSTRSDSFIVVRRIEGRFVCTGSYRVSEWVCKRVSRMVRDSSSGSYEDGSENQIPE